MNVIDWLNSTLFVVAGQAFTVCEILGFVTGALCVWAVTRQYTWNWPVGIANNAVFVVLFLGAGLYADTLLQVVFAVVGAYGWWAWRHGTDHAGQLPVRRARPVEMVAGVGAAAVGTVLVAQLLTTHTDSRVPWPDAFILAASLLATWGQARKILAQWWVWIAVDVVSIPLYMYKGLWLTAILYAGFLALCIDGLRRWRAELRTQIPADTTWTGDDGRESEVPGRLVTDREARSERGERSASTTAAKPRAQRPRSEASDDCVSHERSDRVELSRSVRCQAATGSGSPPEPATPEGDQDCPQTATQGAPA